MAIDSARQGRRLEIATFGGGCFWCLEPVFRELRGVRKVVTGYAGGSIPNPTYEQVSSGATGHAEVVQVTFDPSVISYAELLEVFFSTHDPTTIDRQGADAGPQYRSIILYSSPSQEAAAREAIALMEQEKVYASPIVTEVKPLGGFFQAEEYHQEYFDKNPDKAYCRLVIAPKLAKFKERFAPKLK